MSENFNDDTYENLENKEKKFIRFFISLNLGILFFIILVVYLVFSNRFEIVLSCAFVCAIAYPYIIIKYYEGKKTFQKKISTEKNFENLNYKKIIFRYLQIDKKFTVFLNIFIISLGITIIFLFINLPGLENNQNIFLKQMGIISTIITGGISFTIVNFKWSFSDRKEFEYYLAQNIFRLITDFPEIDELEKTRLSIFGIQSYEIYIKDELKLHFMNKEILYAKIISSTLAEMDKEIKTIMNMLNQNKLDLLRYFEKCIVDIGKTSLLNRIILVPKIKYYLPLFSVPISIVLVIINFFK